jgi:opacity protein-like surface antigen
MIGRLIPLLCVAALLGQMIVPAFVSAEWYAAGYGGISLEGLLRNVGMPTLGQTRAQAKAGTVFTNDPADPLNRIEQKMDVSDLKLKDSPILGAKVGYYFNDYGYQWLGVELEAFSTQPNVKAQTFETTQTAVYSSGGAGFFAPAENPTVCGPPGTANPARCNGPTPTTGTVRESRLRVSTVAANLVVRHPGKFLEPYAGVGVGVFHFLGSGEINGTTVVPGLNALAGIKWHAGEHLSLFAEYKYNRATFEGLGTSLGLGANYQITHVVGGVGWHF